VRKLIANRFLHKKTSKPQQSQKGFYLLNSKSCYKQEVHG